MALTLQLAYAFLVVCIIGIVWRKALDRDDGGYVDQGRVWRRWPDRFTEYDGNRLVVAHDKVGHFLGGAVCMLGAWATGYTWLGAFLLTLGAGALWELQQWYPVTPPVGKPSRYGHASWKDLLTDAGGALLASPLWIIHVSY